MDIDSCMLNNNYLRKEKIVKEMNDYLKHNHDKNSQEYKNKYSHYLSSIAFIDSQTEEYMEDEIDVLRNHDNPYLKLKYWISSYTNYYYKILKHEYFKITKEIKIDVDINDIEETIRKLEKNISKLKNEEKINYILNINRIITSKLK